MVSESASNVPRSDCEGNSHDETASSTGRRTPSAQANGNKRANRSRGKGPTAGWKFDCYVKESHGHSIFGVTFNKLVLEEYENASVFATVGRNQCSIYECPEEGGLTLKCVFADPDPSEEWYTCDWSFSARADAYLIAVGGLHGIIRVYNVRNKGVMGSYMGHGASINELKFHPKKLNLLLSASKDHGVRLTDIESHRLIAIFGGIEGHRDEVISIDFHLSGNYFMSCGMDHSFKFWKINTPDFEEVLALAKVYDIRQTRRPFPTLRQNYPDYTTRHVHCNYVDCVRFFGDFIFSKSCESAIICWKPGSLSQGLEDLSNSRKGEMVKICEYQYRDCDIWYMRFEFNVYNLLLAFGNQVGNIFVWELSSDSPRNRTRFLLAHPKCNTAVRQTSVNRKGNILVCVCDDSTVWRWNRVTDMQEE